MGAVYRKELRTLFSSMLGYVYLAVFYFLASVFFIFNSITPGYENLSGVISSMFIYVLFLIPIITMRLFSDEMKNKTDQALLTAPVKIGHIVVGKFFGAFTMYAIATGIMLVFAFVLNTLTPMDWGSTFVMILGMLLIGAALIAIGLFLSALTESQMVAIIITFISFFLLYMLDSFAAGIQNPTLAGILTNLSFFTRYQGFLSGLLDYSNVAFFISIVGLFLFYTTKVIERRRYI